MFRFFRRRKPTPTDVSPLASRDGLPSVEEHRPAASIEPAIEDHLSRLAARMSACLLDLERALAVAQDALPYVSDEADKSRHVERKARFVTYREVLTSSSIDLDESVTRLRSAHQLCTALENALRMGYFNASVGATEATAIYGIVHSLEREPSIDDIWRQKVQSIIREFNLVLNDRDRKAEDERLRRRGFEAEWEKSAAENTRMPKPTGHRDGWNS